MSRLGVADRWRSVVWVVSLALPWLNPFAPGPEPAVVPLLVTWACVAVALGVRAWAPDAAEAWRQATLAWAVAALLAAGIGWLQFMGWSGRWGGWINATEVGEAYGHLRQRNQFASQMALGWVAVSAWLAGAAGRWSRGRLALWGALAALALALGAAASASRTGLLAWVGVGLVLVWGPASPAQPLPPWVRWIWVAGGWGGYVAAVWALPRWAGLDPATFGAWSRLQAGDALCIGRRTLWNNVLHLIGQKPWSGWGWGELDYAHFATLYPGPRFCDLLDNAHNLPLHLAVEGGIPLAVGVCAGLVLAVWRGRPWREADPQRRAAWAMLAVVGLHSLLEYPLWYGPFQVLVLVCVLWLAHSALKTAFSDGFGRAARIIRRLVAFLLIAAVAAVAAAYDQARQAYLPLQQRRACWGPLPTLADLPRGPFADLRAFAALTSTPVTPQNAALVNAQARTLLHYSPEPRVIQALLDSAVLLGARGQIDWAWPRFAAAYPAEARAWALRQAPGTVSAAGSADRAGS